MSKLPNTATKDERNAAHQVKMLDKAVRRQSGKFPGRYKQQPRYEPTGFDAQINRHTGEPHEHRREIARRLNQEKVQ